MGVPHHVVGLASATPQETPMTLHCRSLATPWRYHTVRNNGAGVNISALDFLLLSVHAQLYNELLHDCLYGFRFAGFVSLDQNFSHLSCFFDLQQLRTLEATRRL